jgi:hypothetical protein
MTVAYVAHDCKRFTSSTSLVIPKPAGVADGDLLVAVIMNDTNTSTPPAGWSTLRASSAGAGSAGNVGVFYKIAASEGASFAFAHSLDSASGIVIAYRGVDQSTPIGDLASAADMASNLSFTAPTTTPTRDGMAVAAVMMSYSANPSFSAVDNGFTLRHTGHLDAAVSDDGTTSMGSAEKAAVAGAAVGSTVLTSSFGAINFGVMFVIYAPFTSTHQMLV